MKTASMSIRIDPELRMLAEGVLDDIGMTVSEAVTVFFKQVVYYSGLPFSVRRPRFNDETFEAIQEARDFIDGKTELKGYNTFAEFKTEMDAEIKAELAGKKVP